MILPTPISEYVGFCVYVVITEYLSLIALITVYNYMLMLLFESYTSALTL